MSHCGLKVNTEMILDYLASKTQECIVDHTHRPSKASLFLEVSPFVLLL